MGGERYEDKRLVACIFENTYSTGRPERETCLGTQGAYRSVDRFFFDTIYRLYFELEYLAVTYFMDPDRDLGIVQYFNDQLFFSYHSMEKLDKVNVSGDYQAGEGRGR